MGRTGADPGPNTHRGPAGGGVRCLAPGKPLVGATSYPTSRMRRLAAETGRKSGLQLRIMRTCGEPGEDGVRVPRRCSDQFATGTSSGRSRTSSDVQLLLEAGDGAGPQQHQLTGPAHGRRTTAGLRRRAAAGPTAARVNRSEVRAATTERSAWRLPRIEPLPVVPVSLMIAWRIAGGSRPCRCFLRHRRHHRARRRCRPASVGASAVS